MPGTYHIITAVGYAKQRVSCYQTGPGHRHKSHIEESAPSACGRTVVQGRDQFCNISIANPRWDYDWCHDCVRAFSWPDKARKLWLAKGIETVDHATQPLS